MKKKGLSSIPKIVQNGLFVDKETQKVEKEIEEKFKVQVPSEYLEQLKTEEALQRQFIPSFQELKISSEELGDPIGDLARSAVPFVVHRYPDRALLLVTYLCAVYCRYCFRREKVSNGQENPSLKEMENAFVYLEKTKEIKEVILTGGDPLVLGESRLKAILQRLENIDHIETLRIHTRVPVATPSWVTPSLVQMLANCKLPIWIVLHLNHPSEITANVEKSLQYFSGQGIPLLSQSVLLKGVNDSVEILEKLCRCLIRHKITPYYLHYPDLAKGTSHFRIPLSKAISLISDLRGKISGFAIPRLTVDIPKGLGKIVLEEERAFLKKQEGEKETWIFISPLTGQECEISY